MAVVCNVTGVISRHDLRLLWSATSLASCPGMTFAVHFAQLSVIITQGRYLAFEISNTSTTVTLTWQVCKYKIHKLHQRYILKKATHVFVAVPVLHISSAN